MRNTTEIKMVVLGEKIVDEMMGASLTQETQLVFTGQAQGAIPNGTRVRKSIHMEGDTFDIGTLGTIISSIGPVTKEMTDDLDVIGEYGYTILFDPFPTTPVLTRSSKIEITKDGA